MEKLIEVVAIANFENWGGSWNTAPEFRKQQSREEAKAILAAISRNPEAKQELMRLHDDA